MIGLDVNKGVQSVPTSPKLRQHLDKKHRFMKPLSNSRCVNIASTFYYIYDLEEGYCDHVSL